MELDKRKQRILSIVIDEFVKTGEPVGSKTIAALLDNSVSSATIRNDMAALERLGLLEQPHTSSGRIPTSLGYRLYIDEIMEPEPLSRKEKLLIDDMLGQHVAAAGEVVEHAVHALSQITGCAAVNRSNVPNISVISRVEVIPAGRRIYALLVITSTGDVKNKVCRVEFDLTYEQIDFIVKFLNRHLQGVKLDELNQATMQNLAVALGSYMMTLSPLLYAVYELTDEISHGTLDITGQEKLLSTGLRTDEVANFLSRKDSLSQVLEKCFDGVHVFFGKENGTFAISNSSLILSQYRLGNADAGTLGIIGPVRLDYAKFIPYIEYFSDSVSRLLTELAQPEGLEHKEEEAHGSEK